MGSTQMLGSKNVLTCCVEKKGVGTKVWSILFVGVDNIFLNLGSHKNGVENNLSDNLTTLFETICTTRLPKFSRRDFKHLLETIFKIRLPKYSRHDFKNLLDTICKIRLPKFSRRDFKNLLETICVFLHA